MTKKQTRPVKMATNQSEPAWLSLEISPLQGKVYLCHHFYPGYFKTLAKAQYWEKGRLSIDRPNQIHATDSVIQADSNQTHLPFDLYVTVDYGDVFRTNIVLETLLSLVPLIIAVLSTISDPLYSSTDDPTDETTHPASFSARCRFYQARCDRRPRILEIDQANHKLNQVLIHMKDLQIRAYHAQLNLKRSNSITSKIKSDPILPSTCSPWFTACSKPGL